MMSRSQVRPPPEVKQKQKPSDDGTELMSEAKRAPLNGCLLQKNEVLNVGDCCSNAAP